MRIRSWRGTRALVAGFGVAILCGASFPIGAYATHELVVGDFGDAYQVVLLNPQTGNSEVIAQSGQIRRVFGVATKQDGQIFVSSFDNSAIVVADTTGAQSLLTIGGLIQSPRGVAVSLGGEFVYVVDSPQSEVIQIDTITGLQAVISSGGGLIGTEWITVGLDGMIYATAGGDLDHVIRVIPSSGAQELVSSKNLLVEPTGIATDQDGQLYVACFGNDTVVRIDPDSGQQFLVGSGNLISEPYGVALTGERFVYVSSVSQSQIVGVDKNNGSQFLIPVGVLMAPRGLAPLINPNVETIPPPPNVIECEASDDLASRVEITWTDVEGESGYRIYRDGEPIASVQADVVSYSDFALPGTYTYCVAAFASEESDHCCDEGSQRDLIPEPRINFVTDAPLDNGGKVVIGWQASDLDVPWIGTIKEYLIWRRVDPTIAHESNADIIWSPQSSKIRDASPGDELWSPDGVSFWEAIGVVPSGFREAYGYTAETLRDSLPGDNPYTAFIVSAVVDDSFEFLDSAVDSGYSVDNLAPSTPTGLAGVYESGVGVTLHWNPNGEHDLKEYTIYRGIEPDFEPSDLTRIGTTSDTSFVDPDGLFNYYKLSAVDLRFNESGFALLESDDIPVPSLIKLFHAEEVDGGVQVDLQVDGNSGVEGVVLWRGSSSEFDQAVAITAALSLRGNTDLSFVDTDVVPGESYWYWADVQKDGRRALLLGPVPVTYGRTVFGTTSFRPVRPNPMSQSGVFSYVIGTDIALDSDSRVRLTVYDSRGRRVRTLIDSSQGVGEFSVTWNGRDDAGRRLSAGIYFVWFRVGQFEARASVVIVR